jgi:uncharacterized Fe-S cluster-containing radical SAM superfamily protein
MDKNTGTDNVVQRLSGADTVAEQAAEIAALRGENERLRDESLRKRMASGERFYTLSPDDLGRIVAERDGLRARVEALEALIVRWHSAFSDIAGDTRDEDQRQIEETLLADTETFLPTLLEKNP